MVSNYFWFSPRNLGKMNPFWLYNIFQGGWFNHQPDVVSSNKTNGDTKSRGLHVGCLFVKLEPWNFLDIDPAVWWILGRLEPPHNQWCLENPSKMIPWWSHVVQMLKNAWNLTSKKNRSFRIQSLRVLEFKEPFHTFLFLHQIYYPFVELPGVFFEKTTFWKQLLCWGFWKQKRC